MFGRADFRFNSDVLVVVVKHTWLLLRFLFLVVLFFRLTESIAWKSFSTDAVHSFSPSDVISDITNDVLADLKQVRAGKT